MQYWLENFVWLKNVKLNAKRDFSEKSLFRNLFYLPSGAWMLHTAPSRCPRRAVYRTNHDGGDNTMIGYVCSRNKRGRLTAGEIYDGRIVYPDGTLHFFWYSSHCSCRFPRFPLRRRNSSRLARPQQLKLSQTGNGWMKPWKIPEMPRS